MPGCNVELGELITFEKPRAQLQRLDAKTQRWLEELMDKNNDGRLTAAQKREFAQLADRAHRLSIENARMLKRDRRRSDRIPTRSAKARVPVSA